MAPSENSTRLHGHRLRQIEAGTAHQVTVIASGGAVEEDAAARRWIEVGEKGRNARRARRKAHEPALGRRVVGLIESEVAVGVDE